MYIYFAKALCLSTICLSSCLFSILQLSMHVKPFFKKFFKAKLTQHTVYTRQCIQESYGCCVYMNRIIITFRQFSCCKKTKDKETNTSECLDWMSRTVEKRQLICNNWCLLIILQYNTSLSKLLYQFFQTSVRTSLVNMIYFYKSGLLNFTFSGTEFHASFKASFRRHAHTIGIFSQQMNKGSFKGSLNPLLIREK